MAKKKLIDIHDKRVGITYVYEDEPYWDKEKQQGRHKRKLVGKRDPITKELIPTNGQKKRMRDLEAISQLAVTRKRYGATYLLNAIAKSSGLKADLAAIFPNDYRQILALAYYLVLSPTNAMHQFPLWAEEHETFQPKDLTSQRITEIFRLVKEDEKQRFFSAQIARHTKEEFWIYDTTSISSYSQALNHVEYGHNKEQNGLPQINLGLVYGKNSRLPVMYRHLTGNVPDSKTVSWLLALFDQFPKESIQLVMDRGFYTQENVLNLCKENIEFVIGAKKSVNYIKEVIDQSRETIETVAHYNPASELFMVSGSVGKEFKAGKSSHYPVIAHVYYHPEQAMISRRDFMKKIHETWQALNTKQVSLADVTQYKKCYTYNKDKKTYEIHQEAVDECMKNKGYFVLLTNTRLSSEEVLRIYREKDEVEKAFNNLKDRLNMRRVRVSSDSSLEGKLFVQYIALILNAHLRQRLSKNHPEGKVTLEEALVRLDRIERFIHPEYGQTVGEILKKQEDLYKIFEVTPPN